jgi:two-component sensor histidine kinase
VSNEAATSNVAHFRLLSDAMEEFCSARTQEEVVRISATLAQKACQVDSICVVLSSGEEFHCAPASNPDTVEYVCSKAILRISAWALEARQTAVVPDIHLDERTRSHTNNSTLVRSLVAVPVGSRNSAAAVTCAWSQEHWPAASEVLVLEALARATGLALVYRLNQDQNAGGDERDSIYEWLSTAADSEGFRGDERRQWLAVAELQHRVRNVLAQVRSIVRQTAETASPALGYSAHLEGRISALARTQGFVMRQPSAGVDLEELVEAEIVAHAARETQVQVAGPPVRLRAKAAETLGLALHELATNAVKYGALATSEGRITVSWAKETDCAEPRVRLEWRESGVTLSERPPAHRGFGTQLLERTVPYELRGSSHLSFESDGVHCVIDIPLTPDNVVAEQTVTVG